MTSSGTTEAYELADPKAECMIHSLRAFGYNLPAAVADIIDNSISADSNNIWLDFLWDGKRSCIAVIDDGKGMAEYEMLEAMRPGSKSPLEVRTPKDLGRFGLGLKTASFSQCRRLTVGSKKIGMQLPSTRCWDLDYVSSCGQWRLLKNGSDAFENYLSLLNGRESGTVVLWEKMDRIVGNTDVNDPRHHDLFLARIDQIKQHIAMVFHRYLSGIRSW